MNKIFSSSKDNYIQRGDIFIDIVKSWEWNIAVIVILR